MDGTNTLAGSVATLRRLALRCHWPMLVSGLEASQPLPEEGEERNHLLVRYLLVRAEGEPKSELEEDGCLRRRPMTSNLQGSSCDPSFVRVEHHEQHPGRSDSNLLLAAPWGLTHAGGVALFEWSRRSMNRAVMLSISMGERGSLWCSTEGVIEARKISLGLQWGATPGSVDCSRVAAPMAAHGARSGVGANLGIHVGGSA